MFGYDLQERADEVGSAFEATEAIKEWRAENFPDEIETRLVKEFMHAYMEGGLAEWGYFSAHPEVLSLSVDMHLATMSLLAYQQGDRHALRHFMGIRENFSRIRLGR